MNNATNTTNYGVITNFNDLPLAQIGRAHV